jgi:hypothetical protein
MLHQMQQSPSRAGCDKIRLPRSDAVNDRDLLQPHSATMAVLSLSEMSVHTHPKKAWAANYGGESGFCGTNNGSCETFATP